MASGDNYAICRFDDQTPDPDVVQEYLVGQTGTKASVFITRDGRYIIKEPPLTVRAEAAYTRLMQNIHHSFTYQDISSEDVIPLLKRTLEEESKATNDFEVWRREKEAVEYYLVRDVAGYAELDVLIRDPHIEDILCLHWNRPVAVVHREHPHHTLLGTNVTFQTESALERLIQRISQRYGEPPSETRPMTSFSDEYGIRYTFTGNRIITPDSPTMSIRKPSVSAVTICHLLRSGLLSVLAAAYLWCVMDLKGFGLVIGAPSAGKTTMINAVFTMSNPHWHYFTIEDVLELKVPHQYVSRHQTTTNSSLHGEQGAGAATPGGNGSAAGFGVFDLCRLSMRFRPDFVVVGEILGREADGLFQAAASGSGCMCSFHASSAEHALTRLEAPPISLSKSQTNLLTYILHMSWVLRDNKRQRKLISITEISGRADAASAPHTDDQRSLDTVFWYDPVKNRLMPEDLDAVVESSTALQNVKVMLGVDDVRKNLESRMSVLQGILDARAADVESIHAAINRYYRHGRAGDSPGP
ncbi:MAG: type II/IV secretion system ATPase subunit [Thaumarchaeota archaeon]|nr:type II/IV secretion system ATPase subunit [Nitrososphaerota archaeon]